MESAGSADTGISIAVGTDTSIGGIVDRTILSPVINIVPFFALIPVSTGRI
jgi:hypothetical protein